MATYVTYDIRSGKVISVHHGSTDIHHVRQRAHQHSKIDPQHIDAIAVDIKTLSKGKRYKVDLQSRTLAEATAGEGLGFSFGVTADLRAP